MSFWSYIQGTIEVETMPDFHSREDLETYVKYVIDEINKKTGGITGSEGPAEFFVNSHRYASMFSNAGEGFTKAYITIHGHLRDRSNHETIPEFKKFISHLYLYMDIENILVRTSDSLQSHLFTSAEIGSDHLSNTFLAEHIDADPYPIFSDNDEEDAVNESKRRKLFRVQQKHAEKYFKMLFKGKELDKYKWALAHMPLSEVASTLDSMRAIEDYTPDIDYIEIYLERGLDIPKSWLDYYNRHKDDQRA